MRVGRIAGMLILSLAGFFFLCACGGGGGDSAPPAAPTTTTSTLNTPSIDNAVINGNVNPNGISTTAWFEYGTDPALATFTKTDDQSVGSGSASLSINATITGLNAGTTYYYRVAASSAAGTTKGTIASFATLSLTPTVVSTTSSPGTDNASVNGTVNPNGLATTAWFEYGTDSSLTTFTKTADQLMGSGKASVPINETLLSLNPTTTYYWRAAASNAAGTSKGTIKSFATTSLPPPIADPGPDQTVFMGQAVALDGSGSSDAGLGGTITYQWTQVAGTAVTLSNATVANPTFTAPTVAYPSEILTFRLTVTSSRPGNPSASDNVNVTVKWGLTDNFSTNTTGTYTVEITGGTFGTFTHDSAGQRALVTTGNDNILQFSKVVPPSNAGVFSLDFNPVLSYPSHAGIWVRLYQNPVSDNTYYEISNFDWSTFGEQPGLPDLAAFKKVVNGVEVEKIQDTLLPGSPFPTSYNQTSTYNIKITFGPAMTTMEAFGQTINLSGTTSTIGKFEIETGQQDAYYDNILLEAAP